MGRGVHIEILTENALKHCFVKFQGSDCLLITGVDEKMLLEENIK